MGLPPPDSKYLQVECGYTLHILGHIMYYSIYTNMRIGMHCTFIYLYYVKIYKSKWPLP